MIWIYIMILNIKNGIIAARTNKTIPILVDLLSLSIIPDIRNKTPINPNIIGIICEKIKVPVNISAGMISHY